MPTEDAAVFFTDVVDMSNSTNVFYKGSSIANGSLAVSNIQQYTQNFGIVIATAPSNKELTTLVCRSAGTLQYVYAGLFDTGSATVAVDFDLLINTSSALNAVIRVDDGDADRANLVGSLSTTAVTAGQVITCKCIATTANNSTGPFMTFGILWTATAS